MLSEKLMDSSTMLGIHILTDDPDNRFKFRKVANFRANKGEVQIVNITVQCFERMIVKMETAAGLHTKIVNCENVQNLGAVNETFAMSLPQATGKSRFINNFKGKAREMVLPFVNAEWVPDIPDFAEKYFGEFDIQEAVSQEIQKIGFVE